MDVTKMTKKQLLSIMATVYSKSCDRDLYFAAAREYSRRGYDRLSLSK